MTKIILKPYEEWTNFYVGILEQKGFVFDRKIKRNLVHEQITLKYTTKTNPIEIIDNSLDELKVKSKRYGIDTYVGAWLLFGKVSRGVFHLIIDTQHRELTFQFTNAYSDAY